jgi:hypothetical protein
MARADSRTWVDLAVALVLASGISVNGVSICSFSPYLREVSITFHS